MNKAEYLENLVEQIRNRRAKTFVLAEIASHIEDQKCTYLADGKSEEEAELLTVREMGDPVETGLQLNKIHRPKTDYFLLGAMAALTLLGIIMQSIILAGFDNAAASSADSMRTVFYNLAGFAVMFLIYFGDYRFLGKYSKPVYFVYLAGAALFSFLHGQLFSYSQTHRIWQGFYMLFIPLFAAFCYACRGQKGKGICKMSALLVLNTFFFMYLGTSPSATMLLSVMTCLITLCAAAYKGIFGGRKKLQTGILLSLSVGIPLLLFGDTLLLGGRIFLLADYQIRRIQVLLNPAAFATEAGYQTLLVRDQLAGVSLFGGGSVGKIGALPGAQYDYVITCLSAYFGLLAALAAVAVIAAYFLRSLHISLMQKNRLGFLLGVSCSVILILKTTVYLAMNFGIGMTVSIDMPFLTYGLQCTVLNFLFMGMILSVYRNTNLLQTESGV